VVAHPQAWSSELKQGPTVAAEHKEYKDYTDVDVDGFDPYTPTDSVALVSGPLRFAAQPPMLPRPLYILSVVRGGLHSPRLSARMFLVVTQLISRTACVLGRGLRIGMAQDPLGEAEEVDLAVERCLKEGLSNMVLLRDGACSDAAMQARATALQALCTAHHVNFVVQRRIGVAASMLADGLQLEGSLDPEALLPLGEVRRFLEGVRDLRGFGRTVLGQVVHTVQDTRRAELLGATYVLVGATNVRPVRVSTTCRSIVRQRSEENAGNAVKCSGCGTVYLVVSWDMRLRARAVQGG
jgi:hypothetical protein